MTPWEAGALAAKIIDAIDERSVSHGYSYQVYEACITDRARTHDDLEGLLWHAANQEFTRCLGCGHRPLCGDARRYTNSLKRTANNYGVTP